MQPPGDSGEYSGPLQPPEDSGEDSGHLQASTELGEHRSPLQPPRDSGEHRGATCGLLEVALCALREGCLQGHSQDS